MATGVRRSNRERPGIFTGNAPRPESFSRGARGAYAAARLVHNIARAWRQGFNTVHPTTAVALAEEQAMARLRERQRQRRHQSAMERSTAVGEAEVEAEEEAETVAGYGDPPVGISGRGSSDAGPESPISIEEVEAVIDFAVSRFVGPGGYQGSRAAGSRGGDDRREGSGDVVLSGMAREDARVVEAAAVRLMEIYSMPPQVARKWARQARASVHRIANGSGDRRRVGASAASPRTPSRLRPGGLMPSSPVHNR